MRIGSELKSQLVKEVFSISLGSIKFSGFVDFEDRRVRVDKARLITNRRHVGNGFELIVRVVRVVRIVRVVGIARGSARGSTGV